ncbi:MAG: PEGA domain-containing protein [Deltaproteobacteria bacterium]|nr:PEGA domain-containing protein [Deltaproteobacteria bacterium]
MRRGLCLKALHRYQEAIAAFERLLREFSTGGSDESRALARTEIQNLRALMGSVRIVVSVPAAEVLVDGAAVGTSPIAAPVDLVGGNHVIQARREGFEAAEERVAVVAGETASVDLTLLADVGAGCGVTSIALDANGAVHIAYRTETDDLGLATRQLGDGIEQNCDGVGGVDGDLDGHASEATGGDDCDDSDDAAFPGAPDAAGDDVDRDCDGADGVDDDGDGHASLAKDEYRPELAVARKVEVVALR